MKVLVSLLFALAILVACNDQSSTKSGQRPDYVLAFSWQPAFCERASRKRECKTQTHDRFDATNFTLHGLWPQPGSNIYCGVDEQQKQLDKKGKWRALNTPRISSEIWQRLKTVMPGTMSALHEHEWLKHGTCYGDSIDEYYEHSLWLMKELNDSELQNLFQENIGNEISGEQIRQAFDKSFGAGAGGRLRISCKRDQNSDRQLITEITLGLSGTIDDETSLETLIVNAEKTKAGCPKGIVDAVGLQ